MKKSHVFAATVLAVAASAAQADLLDDVKSKGELVCGTLGTSQPFSYQDRETRELRGYDVDVCALIAKELGVKVTYKLMSIAARVPELTEGRVDVLAANLGYTPARAQQIDYTHQYFASRLMLLVRQEAGLKTIEELDGRPVGAVKGSSSEADIKRRLPKSRVVGYSDHPSTYLALVQRKVDAYYGSEALLMRMAAESSEKAPTVLIEKETFVEPWGLGIRKGQPRFLAEVNRILDEAERNGAIQQLFEKNFGMDTPYKMSRKYKVEPISAS